MRVRELARVEVADQRLGDDYEGNGGPGVHGGLGQRRSDGSRHGATSRPSPRIINFIGGTVSQHLGVDLGAARYRELKILEHQRRASLGEDNAVSKLVVRP